MFAKGRASEAQQLEASFKELEEEAYNRLNPLLEEAAERLEELGINWKKFGWGS